jgi:hypothetical protein
MARRKASDQDILACQQAGLTVTESANALGVSEGAVRQRAKKLCVKFISRRGTPSRALGEIVSCETCPDRKLCIMCHRLGVHAIPCEAELSDLAEDRIPARWPARYARLRAKVP